VAEPVRIATDTGGVEPATGFRALATMGGAIRIDHPVLREPGIERVRLGLEWSGLPPCGFSAYYAGYPASDGLRNQAFRVTICAPVPGWSAGDLQVALFTGDREDGPVDSISWFDLSAAGGAIAAPGDWPLTVTLAAPETGFGDAAYASALAAASLALASAPQRRFRPVAWLLRRLFGLKKPPAALPNPPWQPLIAKVHLSVQRDAGPAESLSP
jgi:hypothetical protein